MVKRLLLLAALATCLLVAVFVVWGYFSSGSTKESRRAPTRLLAAGKHLNVWWDALPPGVAANVKPTGADSNIHPSDYAGAESCRNCHKTNYQSWSEHSHRWMNARATPETVKGDFSDAAEMSYRGGRATFRRKNGRYLMTLERSGTRRTFEITQTIGMRFYQYYVGREIEGPEAEDHPFRTQEHVLHFGYWLEQKQWVPVVHIGPEVPDKGRPDPFAPPEDGVYFAEYASSCNYCHTTFPLGDLFGRRTAQMGEYAPLTLHWSMRKYVAAEHPESLSAMTGLLAPSRAQNDMIDNPMRAWDASHYAVSFGISCEACHLGAKAHVASGGRVPPRFFPASPHLSVSGEREPDFGRTHDNVNWACGRCHIGNRPHFAAGMSTWNSVEYSDAMKGSCYSKLRCVDCHNPHRAIGRKWSLSAEQDDALCLKCHSKLNSAAERARHTHHPAGSAGDRCMNCHMPRINEGVQDVVRTHMIYSPTRRDMLEANHPNACNLCHTDRPIDWTLGHLKEWYGTTVRDEEIVAHYPQRHQPVGLGWLKSDNPAVRLVAADAVARRRDQKMLAHLLDALDDPYLVNRQFALSGVQDWLNIRLSDFGYRFYMTGKEREAALKRIQGSVLLR